MTQAQHLSQRLAFWADHLRQCSLRGQRLSHYAAEHGLSASSLYAARSTLRQRGLWPLPPTRFLRVEADPGGKAGSAAAAANTVSNWPPAISTTTPFGSAMRYRAGATLGGKR